MANLDDFEMEEYLSEAESSIEKAYRKFKKTPTPTVAFEEPKQIFKGWFGFMHPHMWFQRGTKRKRDSDPETAREKVERILNNKPVLDVAPSGWGDDSENGSEEEQDIPWESEEPISDAPYYISLPHTWLTQGVKRRHDGPEAQVRGPKHLR